jgi:sirohydrochlorin ferrochelatase
MCYMVRSGLLLIGHGSKKPYNKELIESTAALIAEKDPSFIVKAGFMSLNTPTVTETLEEFRKEDIDRLVVVPLFLAKGVHILIDIPGILGIPEGSNSGTFRLNGKEVPLVYAQPIGSDPLLADLMLKNAYLAIQENP